MLIKCVHTANMRLVDFSKHAGLNGVEGLMHPMEWISSARAKVATTVRLDGKLAVQQGHDVGRLIPHVLVGPLIVAIPVSVLAMSQSRYIIAFGSSHALANGRPMGGAMAGQAPPVYCFEPVDIISQTAVTNFVNTVQIGLDAADVARGWVFVALNAYESHGRGTLPEQVAREVRDWLMRPIRRARNTVLNRIRRALSPVEERARDALRRLRRALPGGHGLFSLHAGPAGHDAVAYHHVGGSTWRVDRRPALPPVEAPEASAHEALAPYRDLLDGLPHAA